IRARNISRADRKELGKITATSKRSALSRRAIPKTLSALENDITRSIAGWPCEKLADLWQGHPAIDRVMSFSKTLSALENDITRSIAGWPCHRSASFSLVNNVMESPGRASR